MGFRKGRGHERRDVPADENAVLILKQSLARGIYVTDEPRGIDDDQAIDHCLGDDPELFAILNGAIAHASPRVF
jgi:hypothetical protein